MKGKTIIELTDVRSGKKERVEHKNTFQSTVLEKLFSPLGSLGISLISGSANQWQSLVGGLLVFDKTIEVGTQYPPADVNMTANGAYNVVNNTDPVELGSWNQSESYITKDEIVMTYNFTMSQGNGTINSVCLTSATAGKAGIGNGSQTRLPQGSCVQPFIGGQGYIPTLSDETHICTDGTYYYVLSKSGATLSVKKRWANITGIDLIKGANTNAYDDEYTITLPSDYASTSLRYDPIPTQIAEAKLAFIKDRGSNYTAIIVDVANRNVSNEITIPKLGGIMAVTGAYPLEVAQTHTDNDVSYVSIYDTDSAQWVADYETSWSVDNCLKLGDRYYFRDSDSGWVTATDGVISPMNVRWLNGNYVAHGSYLPTLDKIQQNDDYAGLGRNIVIPSMYLATINNLEDEIVKDSSKTMKIIYTLSRR